MNRTSRGYFTPMARRSAERTSPWLPVRLDSGRSSGARRDGRQADCSLSLDPERFAPVRPRSAMVLAPCLVQNRDHLVVHDLLDRSAFEPVEVERDVRCAAAATGRALCGPRASGLWQRGFRGLCCAREPLAHIDGHHCALVSRNGHTFKQWRTCGEELA